MESAVFRKEGEYWTIVYRGAVIRLRGIKGLGYLSRMLQSPRARIHTLELCGWGNPGGVGDAERARQRIKKAVKAAIDRITENDPELGYHLATAIRTGHFCSYNPDPNRPISWQL